LKEKTKCCFAGWHKNCDQKIKQKGGERKGKKDRGSFNKCLYNQIISFIKTAGFFALVQGRLWNCGGIPECFGLTC